MTLLKSPTVQFLWSLAKLSLTLLSHWWRAFFLDLHCFSLACRSLFRTVQAVLFTPVSVCHCVWRSLDVSLRFLSDIRMSLWSSRSVLVHFHSLPGCSFVVPSAFCLTLFLCPTILEILSSFSPALMWSIVVWCTSISDLPSNWSHCKNIVLITVVIFYTFPCKIRFDSVCEVVFLFSVC